MKFLTDTKILLCRTGSCCPTIEKIEDDLYSITDDFGGSVKLTADHIEMVKQAQEKLQK